MRFLPVKGYEGLYEVSELGQVRSVERKIQGKDGAVYPFKERILRPHPHKDTGYLQVSLWKENKGTHQYIHRIVAEAFIPNPHGLKEVNHLDGNRQNNHLLNLEWVSRKGNAQHAIETKLKVYTNRLSYNEFYDCLLDVIDGESYGSLSQRVPYKVPFLSTKLRQIARELGLEGELNDSLLLQAKERARKNGAKNNQTNRCNH